MKYTFILIFSITLSNSHAQDSTKLYYPPNSFLKNAFIWNFEIFNLKMKSTGISIHANTDSVFINYDCKVNKIFEFAGFGLIQFDIGDGYLLWLGHFKNWTINKNESLNRGRCVGIADIDEGDADLYSLFVLISRHGKFLSIDEHLAFFQLKQ